MSLNRDKHPVECSVISVTVPAKCKVRLIIRKSKSFFHPSKRVEEHVLLHRAAWKTPKKSKDSTGFKH